MLIYITLKIITNKNINQLTDQSRDSSDFRSLD